MARERTIAPGERYAALFGSALGELPGAASPRVRRWREANFERFRALGLPGPKTEAWKYTPVSSLARQEFRLPAATPVERSALAPFLIAEPGARRLVFVDGRFAPGLSDDLSAVAADGIAVTTLAAALERGGDDLLELAPVQGGERAFTALNQAFAGDGCLIRVAGGAAPGGPLHLIFVTAGGDVPCLVSPRNLVVVEHGARLDLVESHVALGAGEHLVNLVSEFQLGRGAELRHDRLEFGGAGRRISRYEYQISADARLTQCLVTLGGDLVRNEIAAVIDGAGIDAHFNGLFLARERQHVDNMLLVDHARPGSESNQFYKGVLDGRAQGVFAGKIVVRRDAQKTNAFQSNNNLLLSPDAEIDTKPELEIYADDVKCSHGATAGELDERELFYLRSRGMDPVTARSLLTFAFAGEVLERFASAAAGRRARAEVLRWLPGGKALQELE